MHISNSISWHQSQWEMLDISNLSHALLFRGHRGLGKFIFAQELARLMLCKCENKRQEDSSATRADDNKCASCHLLTKGNNPDFFVINHEHSKQIVIDDILSLRDFLLTTSHFGGAKVAIINNADMMNLSSANALLKILEEPPAKKYIFLCSANNLLPTILSRCLQVHFSPPSRDELIKWLETSGELGKLGDVKNKIADKTSTQTEDGGTDLFFAMNNYAPFAVLEALDNFELVAKLNSALRVLEKKSEQKSEQKSTSNISQISWKDYANLSILDIIDIMLWRVQNHLMSYSSADINTKASLLLAFRAMLLARRAMIIDKINLNREILLDEILSSFLRAFLASAKAQ